MKHASDAIIPDYHAAMDRMREVTGSRTQQDLARFFGVKQSSISDAKRREAIPAEWLLKIVRHKRINPDWILTGQEPRMLQTAESEKVSVPVAHIEVRPPEHCSSQELITELVRRALKTPSLNRELLTAMLPELLPESDFGSLPD